MVHPRATRVALMFGDEWGAVFPSFNTWEIQAQEKSPGACALLLVLCCVVLFFPFFKSSSSGGIWVYPTSAVWFLRKIAGISVVYKKRTAAGYISPTKAERAKPSLGSDKVVVLALVRGRNPPA